MGFKLAASLLLVAALLHAMSVNGCVPEEQTCNPVAPDCCVGLECREVSPGTYQCEPVGCESHVGHTCNPSVPGYCCSPLDCVAVAPNTYECQAP